VAGRSRLVDDRVARLRARAVERRLRMTPQREVLLRILGHIPHHPTADELYRRVRRVLPSVSAATVYRNVQTLVDAGVLSVLERAGEAIRYDPNPEDHHHFVCDRCGRVTDVYVARLDYALDTRRSALGGAEVRACAVQFHGLCARCRARREAAR
jgi:Fur family peroxide stress response transcriptional regulator